MTVYDLLKRICNNCVILAIQTNIPDNLVLKNSSIKLNSYWDASVFFIASVLAIGDENAGMSDKTLAFFNSYFLLSDFYLQTTTWPLLLIKMRWLPSIFIDRPAFSLIGQLEIIFLKSLKNHSASWIFLNSLCDDALEMVFWYRSSV